MFVYVASAGIPRRVRADMKLATMEQVTGSVGSTRPPNSVSYTIIPVI